MSYTTTAQTRQHMHYRKETQEVRVVEFQLIPLKTGKKVSQMNYSGLEELQPSPRVRHSNA